MDHPTGGRVGVGWKLQPRHGASLVGSLTYLRFQDPAGDGSQSHRDPNPVKYISRFLTESASCANLTGGPIGEVSPNARLMGRRSGCQYAKRCCSDT